MGGRILFAFLKVSAYFISCSVFVDVSLSLSAGLVAVSLPLLPLPIPATLASFGAAGPSLWGLPDYCCFYSCSIVIQSDNIL